MPSPSLVSLWPSNERSDAQYSPLDDISDTVETYFDSHVDLLQRKLQKHSDRLKMKAEEQRFKIKDLSGDLLSTENFDKEMKNMKLKVRHPSTLARAEHQHASHMHSSRVA